MKFNNAIILSILIHAGLIGLLLTNYQFSKVEMKQSGTPAPKINARAVNSKRVEQLVEKLKKEKVDKRLLEQKRLDDLKKAEEAAKKRRQDEERKAEEARKSRAQAEQRRKDEEKKAADLKKKREQEEIERKKKADLEKRRKEEAERKRKAEEERKRKAEAERKRKAEEERKRKAAEEKARQEALEKEMQEQMAAEAAELEAAQQQYIMTEKQKWIGLISGTIKRNWIEPETKDYCRFQIKLAPGGLVIDIRVLQGNQAHCESGRRAILKAEPVPVPSDPVVFDSLRTLTFDLENEKNED